MTTAFRTVPLALSLLLAAHGASADTQAWEYKSYKKGGLGAQYDKDKFVLGTIYLDESDGKATWRMEAGANDACLRGSLPAEVTRTDATTTIEPKITLAGCERFRYVIRNDGSGGHREVWRQEQWVNTKWDHGLTPVKK